MQRCEDVSKDKSENYHCEILTIIEGEFQAYYKYCYRRMLLNVFQINTGQKLRTLFLKIGVAAKGSNR